MVRGGVDATRAARVESQHWSEAAEGERAAVRGALAPAAAGVVLELGVLALGGTFGGPSSPR